MKRLFMIEATGELANGTKTTIEKSIFDNIAAHISNETGRHGFISHEIK